MMLPVMRDERHADGDAADERDRVEQRIDAQRRGEARRGQREGRDRRTGDKAHDEDEMASVSPQRAESSPYV